jgi:hypothetical protein
VVTDRSSCPVWSRTIAGPVSERIVTHVITQYTSAGYSPASRSRRTPPGLRTSRSSAYSQITVREMSAPRLGLEGHTVRAAAHTYQIQIVLREVRD